MQFEGAAKQGLDKACARNVLLDNSDLEAVFELELQLRDSDSGRPSTL